MSNEIPEELSPEQPQADSQPTLEEQVAILRAENQFLQTQISERGLSEPQEQAVRETVRDAIEQTKPQLPDPFNCSTEEYFLHREELVKKHGLRRPNFGYRY